MPANAGVQDRGLGRPMFQKLARKLSSLVSLAKTELSTLEALHLQVGQRFGYTFDMGDQWEHTIEVVAVAEARGKGKYPRVAKKVGKAPPQYLEDDEDA